MKQITIVTMALSMAIGLSGCASISDSVIECEMGIRNRVLAQKAWGHWSWVYDCLDHPTHFACGFKAGYRDILSGGSGCQPTLPPQCYWKPQFQCPEGQCKIHSWFDGFSHGALAAKQDGYGDIGQIPISPTARANLEAARRPAVQNDIYSSGHIESPVSTDHEPIQLAPPSVPDAIQVPVAPADVTVPTRPYE